MFLVKESSGTQWKGSNMGLNLAWQNIIEKQILISDIYINLRTLHRMTKPTIIRAICPPGLTPPAVASHFAWIEQLNNMQIGSIVNYLGHRDVPTFGQAGYFIRNSMGSLTYYFTKHVVFDVGWSSATWNKRVAKGYEEQKYVVQFFTT